MRYFQLSQNVMWRQSHIAEMLAERSIVESNLGFLVGHGLIDQQTLRFAVDYQNAPGLRGGWFDRLLIGNSH
ncbi:MAG TPA: hypothetical protein VKA79_16415 [Aestuariivirgaceae bacterium]|nr:hypothetical protein [Aestuariivirgaceae bacterium]